MSCLDVDDVLALLEGTLTAEQRATFTAHLDVCEMCRCVVAESARSDDESDAFPAPAGPLVRGTTIDRYIIIDWLGRGGMGVVYAAYDPKLDRRVALKLVHTSDSTDATTRAERYLAQSRSELLLSEARSMAQIVHPNVVTVFDVGTFGDEIFVAMEEVRGGTLAEWLAKDLHAVSEIASVFLAAGRGLAAAHAAGIVHRDFKPQNVLFGERGEVKVGDFGLARPALEDGIQGDVAEPRAGTRAYMAPEIVAKGGSSPRADQWSYCKSFRNALEDATQDRDLRAVPAHVRRALTRGLSSDPAERFATMEGLLAALTNDPRRRLRRALFAALGVVAVIAALVTVRHTAHRTGVPSCSDGAARIGVVLSEEALKKIHAAFVSHGGANAETSFAHTEAALRAYGQKWSTMHDEACRATHVRGEQSGELLDLRMQCLADSERGLASLLALLEVADAGTVRHAMDAVSRLSPIASCADVVALRETVKRPSDPGRRAAIDDVSSRVARARALHNLGKMRDALELGRANVEAANELGYPPLLAKALVALGHSQLGASESKLAEATLYRAVAAADAGHDDKLKASALNYLVYLLGFWQSRFEDSMRMGALADAAIERAGGDEEKRAELESMLAHVRSTHGHLDAAREDAMRALQRRERIHGPESLEMAHALNNLARVEAYRHEYLAAYEGHLRAMQIRERILGTDAPGLATDCNNVADALRALGRLDEALSFARRAHRVNAVEFGTEHIDTAIAEVTVGQILTSQGKYAEAVALFEHAIGILERVLPDNHAVMAEILLSSSQALEGLGRTGDARALRQRAAAGETTRRKEKSH